MRSVIVSAWDPLRTTDGACLVLHHHLRELAARHDLTVLTPEAADPATRATLPPQVRIRRFAPSIPPPVDHVARRLRGQFDGEPAHVHYVERAGLLRALDEEVPEADVVHLFGWGTAQLWQRLRGAPCVHVAIDPWAPNVRNRRLPRWRQVLEAGEAARVLRHERRHYPRVGAVVVVSGHDAAWLQEQVPDARVEVVRNGVTPGPPPGPPVTDPVVGFHGAFETDANVRAALRLLDDILPEVQRAQPAATALLVGREPPPELVTRRSGAVEVTGAVADVRPELERMAVYVAPVDGPAGMKNKVLEAMAAGLPIVASSAALAGIGAGPGVVVADDPSAAAREVSRLLDDPEARRAAGEENRRRAVEDFSWGASARAIEDLWESVRGAR